MSLQDRGIRVRNDDPSIMYAGNWTIAQASKVNFGNFGPAFSPTLHSTTTISNLVFPFNGSSINVVGTVNIANSSTNPNPTWQCFLDGINLGSPNIFRFPENNWALCSQENIPDGAHELVVNVTSQGMPFYLDYIQYRPSSTVSLENSLITIQNEDHAIDYISGWSASGVIANQTTDPEGLVNVTFVGIQLSWYGIIQAEDPHNTSSGEYSIDGQSYSSFQLLGIPSSSTTTIFNQLFFITPTLQMGTHTLSAKYTGSPGQTPLTLDFLIVANGSFPFTNSLPSNSSGGAGGNSTSNSAPPMNDISQSSTHVGSIVGGIVGVIGGIVICSIIAFLWLKSRKRMRMGTNEVIQHSIIESLSPEPQFVFQAAPPLSKAAESSPQIDESHGFSTNATYQPSQSSINQTSQRFTTTSYSTASSSNDLVSAYTTDATMDGSLGRPPPSRKGSAPVSR